MADAAADRAPYYDYQVVVRGRIVKLQDLDLEDARLALMSALDLIDAIDVNADRTTSAIGRWRDGRPGAAGGLGSLP